MLLLAKLAPKKVEIQDKTAFLPLEPRFYRPYHPLVFLKARSKTGMNGGNFGIFAELRIKILDKQ